MVLHMSRITILRLKLKILVLNKLFDWNISFNCGKKVTFGCNLDIRLRQNSSLFIGDFCHIGDGSLLDCAEGATIKLGHNVLLFKYVFIAARKSIEIGNDSQIAEFSSIRDFDHSFADVDVPIVKQGFKSFPITIGEDVWIGRGVAVLKGVRIGEHSVIGANSVVTKNIPPMTIAVGAPAKVIEELN